MLVRGRDIRFADVVPAALAVAVFTAACGSSSVASVNHSTKTVRWIALFVLFGLVVAWALARGVRERLALPASVVGATIAFGALALVSSLWSVDPRLTAGRAISIGVVLAVAGLLGHVSAVEEGAPARILVGVVAGATAIALAGAVLLVVDYGTAVVPATGDLPPRFRGFGENADTAPLLLAPCFPLIAAMLFRARSRREQTLAVALAVLFLGSVIASGSRGSLIAGFAGTLLVAATAPFGRRGRVLAVGATLVLLGASLAIALAPKSKGYEPQPRTAPAAQAVAPGARPKPQRYSNVEAGFPLDFDIGTQAGPGLKTPRTLFGLSGRGVAWRGALDQADERPIVGYGFGTEGDVFVDRYANFVSGLVENSYIGIDLQLGAVGLVALLALVVALLVAAARATLAGRDAIPPAAVLVAGLALAVVQSFLYAAGNVAALAVWTCGFVGAAALMRRTAP